MAKSPRARRSGGGRVTPKGTQPNGRTSRAADPAPVPHQSGPRRLDPPKAAPGRGMHVPARAGHHRGQR